MDSNIPSRIKELRKKHGLSQAKFAAIIEVSSGNVAQWELEDSLPGAKALINISKNFGVSIDWILLGDEALNRKGPDEELYQAILQFSDDEKTELKTFMDYLIHRKNREEKNIVYFPKSMDLRVAESPQKKESYNGSDQVYIPLLGDSAAGKPIMIDELLEGYIPISKKIAGERAFLVRVKGDSMINANIHDGDLVVIRSQSIIEPGEIGLFRINDEATIKYFTQQGKHICLTSANPKYRPIEVSRDTNFSIVGKVVQVIKKDVAEEKLRHIFEE